MVELFPITVMYTTTEINRVVQQNFDFNSSFFVTSAMYHFIWLDHPPETWKKTAIELILNLTDLSLKPFLCT